MKSVLLLLSLLCVVINAIPIALQVTNALIANTNIQTVINNGGYSQYGISAPTDTCTAAYPAGFTGPLRICIASTLAYPYRNSSGVGFEVDVTANWQSLLTAQYSSSVTVSFVSFTPGSTGLFPAVQQQLTAGNCDVALTSLFQTSSRDAVASASCAYGITGSDYLVGPAAGGSSITDQVSSLNSSSVIIAVGAGSASYNYLTQAVSQATLIQTISTSESLAFAFNSSANVAVGDAPVLLNYAKNVQPTLCGGNCQVYQLTPPVSRIVAYSLQDTTPTAAPTTAPTPAPTTRPSTTARTSEAGAVTFSVVAAAAVVAAVLLM